MDRHTVRAAIARFLAEDVAGGDITSESIFSPDQLGTALFRAKQPMVAAGMEQVAAEVFFAQNPAIELLGAAPDGLRTEVGSELLRVRGPVLDLLKAERVALNLVQRLSGIATLTARYVEAVAACGPPPPRVVDTRKTTPGLRIFEKYAVRVGGGHNHRFTLADGVLVKDNHISECGSIAEAVRRVRARAPHTLRIEVEAESLDQVRDCLECGVDLILLDNMDPATLGQAVEIARGRALLEASGGVTLETVREIAGTGVDFISVGRLTHSAPACDISMRFV